MNDEDNQEPYRKVLHVDGMRVTLSDHRFELSTHAGNEVWEHKASKLLRDWMQWRRTQEKLRESGDLSG